MLTSLLDSGQNIVDLFISSLSHLSCMQPQYETSCKEQQVSRARVISCPRIIEGLTSYFLLQCYINVQKYFVFLNIIIKISWKLSSQLAAIVPKWFVQPTGSLLAKRAIQISRLWLMDYKNHEVEFFDRILPAKLSQRMK